MKTPTGERDPSPEPPQQSGSTGEADGEENSDQLRSIQEVAFLLSLSESDARALFVAQDAVISKDYRDRDAVRMSVARAVVSDDSESYQSRRDAALTNGTYGRPIENATTGDLLRADRMTRLAAYLPYIDEIEGIHRRCLESAHRDGFESAAMAQYLLLSRAIALLRALHDSLAHGHFYALSMLRDIDECLDLAHYFLATQATEKGKRAVRRWFREGHWPSHRECRKEIAKDMAANVAEIEASHHRDLHAELYRNKSLWIHPSFLAIRDVTDFGKNAEGQVTVQYVTYGPDAAERRLWEAAEAFRSSALVPTAQRICMSLFGSFGAETNDSRRLEVMLAELGH